jgi:hypothetical protein
MQAIALCHHKNPSKKGKHPCAVPNNNGIDIFKNLYLNFSTTMKTNVRKGMHMEQLKWLETLVGLLIILVLPAKEYWINIFKGSSMIKGAVHTTTLRHKPSH